jgi:hypothetical protein|tara:strand:- start:3403 stop:4578 length:1176 start_codon:yes stop_codon:yes gene_type:complete
MAYYFLFPEKDTTLYSHPDRTTANTGHDEILELAKEKSVTTGLYYPSRILIKFKNEEIKEVIADTIGHTLFNDPLITKSSVALQLMSTEHRSLTTVLNINCYAVSESWQQGSERYLDIKHGVTSSNGVSWTYKDDTNYRTEWEKTNFAPFTTGSIVSSQITKGGGSWYTSSGFFGTQQFLDGDNLDTKIEVKEIVQKHSASLFANQSYPQGVYNNGFIIKKPDVIETSTVTSFGAMKYFSSDTHTIYPPRLVFKWDDSNYNSTYGNKINSGECNVLLYGNKGEYNQNEIVKFRVNVREKYPDRTFTTTSNYLKVKYFTDKSYYSIRDAHTEEEVIPFDDDFTKMSNDSGGMYFNLYMKSFQPERYYRVLFKHVNDDGTTVYDDKYMFKVIR